MALNVVGGEDGTLDEGDYLLFFGEAYRGDIMAAWYADENTNWITYTQQLTDGTTTRWHPDFTSDMMEKYSTENVYWLMSVADVSPARMQPIDGTPGDAPVPAYYKATAHGEVQWRHLEYHFTSEDTWFWDYVTNTDQRQFPITLTGLYTEPFTAVVRSEYVAVTYSTIYTPDHHVVFKLNNGVDPIVDSRWDGASRNSFEVDIPSTDLVEGVNTLYYQNVEDDSVVSKVGFDWYEIDYLRRFLAVNDEISFAGEITGTWRYQMEGFTQGDIQVYDITDPHLPKKVNNLRSYLDGSYRAEFQTSNDAGTLYYGVGASSILAPKSITRYTPQIYVQLIMVQII